MDVLVSPSFLFVHILPPLFGGSTVCCFRVRAGHTSISTRTAFCCIRVRAGGPTIHARTVVSDTYPLLSRSCCITTARPRVQPHTPLKGAIGPSRKRRGLLLAPLHWSPEDGGRPIRVRLRYLIAHPGSEPPSRPYMVTAMHACTGGLRYMSESMNEWTKCFSNESCWVSKIGSPFCF